MNEFPAWVPDGAVEALVTALEAESERNPVHKSAREFLMVAETTHVVLASVATHAKTLSLPDLLAFLDRLVEVCSVQVAVGEQLVLREPEEVLPQEPTR